MPRASVPVSHVEVKELPVSEIDVCVVGITPTVCNRMNNKGVGQVWFPKGKPNAAEKASNLKHDPIAEFRESPYTLRDPHAPTYLCHLGSMFKQAMMTAALRVPGLKKTEVGQLLDVLDNRISVYGEPTIHPAVVRSADINHTPDVRTRCTIPKWACSFTIQVVGESIREKQVIALLSTAGKVCGVGDWRQEKGSGNYGKFRVTGPNDPEFLDITKTWTRKPQIVAMGAPRPFDTESEEMLEWFFNEAKERGVKVTLPDPSWTPTA